MKQLGSKIHRLSKLFCVSVFILCILSLSACIEIKDELTAMMPGKYRGVFLLEENPYIYYEDDSPARNETIFKGISDEEVPFNFTIGYDDADKPYIVIENAGEKLTIMDLPYGTDRSTSHDTVRIDFPGIDAYIYAEYAENKMQGYYRNMTNPKIRIPFNAFYGEDYRFTDMPEEAGITVDGKWELNLVDKRGKEYTGQVDFKQDEYQLTGELNVNGLKFRFLEGVVQNDKLWLSLVDGENILLFSAQLTEENNLRGYMKLGKTIVLNWEGKRIE